MIESALIVACVAAANCACYWLVVEPRLRSAPRAKLVLLNASVTVAAFDAALLAIWLLGRIVDAMSFTP